MEVDTKRQNSRLLHSTRSQADSATVEILVLALNEIFVGDIFIFKSVDIKRLQIVGYEGKFNTNE